MGHQVIRQPDGKLAVWSTIVDDFVLFDCTPEDIATFYADEARQKAFDDWMGACQRAAETGTSGRYQFAMDWSAAQRLRTEIHGRPFDPAVAGAEDDD